MNLELSTISSSLAIRVRSAPSVLLATSSVSATKSTKSLSSSCKLAVNLSSILVKNLATGPLREPSVNLTQARPLAPNCFANSVNLSMFLREYLSALPLTTIAFTTGACEKTLKSTSLTRSVKSCKSISKRVSGLSEP